MALVVVERKILLPPPLLLRMHTQMCTCSEATARFRVGAISDNQNKCGEKCKGLVKISQVIIAQFVRLWWVTENTLPMSQHHHHNLAACSKCPRLEPPIQFF